MGMNIELLLQIKERILAEPAQFVMGDVFLSDVGRAYEDRGDIRRESIPHCGTAACIAGWAIALHEQTDPKTARTLMRKRTGPGSAATWDALAVSVLGLTPSARWADGGKGGGQRDALFFVSGWPRDLQERWDEAADGAEDDPQAALETRAQIAAERIDRFIAAGGNDYREGYKA